MSLTKHGVSTTTERDCFRYEEYTTEVSRRTKVQWDYRDARGELHSGVACDVDHAKERAREYGYRG